MNKENKSKTSAFMIVINTNKEIKKIDKEKVLNLVDLTKYLVNNFNTKTNNYYVDKDLKPLPESEFKKINKYVLPEDFISIFPIYSRIILRALPPYT